MTKLLVTNESLEKLLEAFQEKIVKRFKERLNEPNAKIIELQSKISIQDNALQKLEITCDVNEHKVVVRVYVPMGFHIMKMILIL